MRGRFDARHRCISGQNAFRFWRADHSRRDRSQRNAPLRAGRRRLVWPAQYSDIHHRDVADGGAAQLEEFAGCAAGRRWYRDGRHQLAALQSCSAGSGDELGQRQGAVAVRAKDMHRSLVAQQRRHAVSRRRRVAHVAAHRGTIAQLVGRDRLAAFSQQRPAAASRRAQCDLVHGHRRADPEIAIANHQQVAHSGQRLDIHDQPRMKKAALNADQQVGHAGHQASVTVVLDQQRAGFFQTIWFYIIEWLHWHEPPSWRLWPVAPVCEAVQLN